MDPTSKLKTDIICDFKPDAMSMLAEGRWGMRIVMTKSNIPKSLWKYYLDAPELWEETEVYDGMRSILMMNSYHNIVPWWMRNATLEDLVFPQPLLLKISCDLTEMSYNTAAMTIYFRAIQH